MQRHDLASELATIEQEEAALAKRKAALLQQITSTAQITATIQPQRKPSSFRAPEPTIEHWYDDMNPHIALSEACQKGDLEAMNALLHQGARIERFHDEDDRGCAPSYSRDSDEWKNNPFEGDALHNAIRGDQPDALQWLMNHLATILFPELATLRNTKADCDEEGKFPLLFPDSNAVVAQIAGVINLHRFLYQSNTPASVCIMSRQNSLLIEAVLANSDKCVEMLVTNFLASTDKLTLYYILSGSETLGRMQKGDALTLAIDHGYTKIAAILVNSGCSLETRYGDRQCMHHGRNSMYQGWDFERDLTPLLLAAIKGNDVMVKLLLEKGADITACDRNGKSALALAKTPDARAVLRENFSLSDRATMQGITTPPSFICPLSKTLFNKPFHYDGKTYDKETYQKININKPYNKKTDPAGKLINEKTYDAILNSPIDEKRLSEITAYVIEEEAKIDNSTNTLKQR